MEGLDTIRGCASRPGEGLFSQGFLFVCALVFASLGSALLAGDFEFEWPSPSGVLLALLGGVFLGLGSDGLPWLHDRHIAFRHSRLIAFGLDLRSGSARWDSPWLARAEEIPQKERIVSLTNPVAESLAGEPPEFVGVPKCNRRSVRLMYSTRAFATRRGRANDNDRCNLLF
jgi:hypothetical protein